MHSKMISFSFPFKFFTVTSGEEWTLVISLTPQQDSSFFLMKQDPPTIAIHKLFLGSLYLLPGLNYSRNYLELITVPILTSDSIFKHFISLRQTTILILLGDDSCRNERRHTSFNIRIQFSQTSFFSAQAQRINQIGTYHILEPHICENALLFLFTCISF